MPITVQTLSPKKAFIVVRSDPIEVKDQTETGIFLTDKAKEAGVKRTGEVVTIGPDVKRTYVGERILFSAHAGTEVTVGGEVLDFMHEDSVLAGIS